LLSDVLFGGDENLSPEAKDAPRLATFTDFGVSMTAPPYDTTTSAIPSEPCLSRQFSPFIDTCLVFTSFSILLRPGDDGDVVGWFLSELSGGGGAMFTSSEGVVSRLSSIGEGSLSGAFEFSSASASRSFAQGGTYFVILFTES
jgi:hypothetical protein